MTSVSLSVHHHVCGARFLDRHMCGSPYIMFVGEFFQPFFREYFKHSEVVIRQFRLTAAIPNKGAAVIGGRIVGVNGNRLIKICQCLLKVTPPLIDKAAQVVWPRMLGG